MAANPKSYRKIVKEKVLKHVKKLKNIGKTTPKGISGLKPMGGNVGRVMLKAQKKSTKRLQKNKIK